MQLEIALLFALTSVISAFLSPPFNCIQQCGFSADFVCSTTGMTFNNECVLKCYWGTKQCDGPCPCSRQSYGAFPMTPGFGMPMQMPDRSTPECNCPNEKDHVCTIDNETYDNICEANCDGKIIACDGVCPCSYS